VKGSSAGGRQPKLLAQKSACAPLQIPQMVKGFPSIEAKLIFFQTPLLPQMIKGAGHRGKIYFQTKTPESMIFVGNIAEFMLRESWTGTHMHFSGESN
jgi:hypothetical protein